MENSSSLKTLLEWLFGGLGLTIIGRMIYASISKKINTVATVKDIESLKKDLSSIVDKIKNLDKKVDRIQKEQQEDLLLQIGFLEKENLIIHKSMDERINKLEK